MDGARAPFYIRVLGITRIRILLIIYNDFKLFVCIPKMVLPDFIRFRR